MCWYGIPLLTDNVLDLAIELDLAVPLEFSEDGDHDWLLSFYNLRDTLEEEMDGIRLELVKGWGTIMDDLPLIAFFTNRDMQDVTREHMGYIHALLDQMKYPEDFKKCLLQWYPDINETVSPHLLVWDAC